MDGTPEFKNPLQLYHFSLKALVKQCVADNWSCSKEDFMLLPNHTVADFYEELFKNQRFCVLSRELSNLHIFKKLLNVKKKRKFLLTCYQAVLNHEHNQDLSEKLLTKFKRQIAIKTDTPKTDLIDLGLKFGCFLIEAGWYDFSLKVLEETQVLLLDSGSSTDIFLQLLECYKLKLNAQSLHCDFLSAHTTYVSLMEILEQLKSKNLISDTSLVGVYCTVSLYYFVQSNYDESYTWAIKALKLLPQRITRRPLPKGSCRAILDTLRQTCKACVVKRKFSQAGLVIRQAMTLGEMLDTKEQLTNFSDILMDYGFYLLNSDSVQESVDAYLRAVDHRKRVFGNNNIYTALAYEDLAYSLYVNEYSSGNFSSASSYAERSIAIMGKVLPANHLLLASVKRVKALILEEIALDERSTDSRRKELLTVAENLHLSALALSQEAFGEKNVQTAKHYGNLGRLYQSMKQFEQAEQMHIKAIAIKEELLGPQDYEVGLSVGHLASLYNYHMKKYDEAEQLYLRSIEINTRLFGPTYSGMEYDYRGLIHVYGSTGNVIQYLEYNRQYTEWKTLRETVQLVHHTEKLMSPRDIVERFFQMEDEDSAKVVTSDDHTMCVMD